MAKIETKKGIEVKKGIETKKGIEVKKEKLIVLLKAKIIGCFDREPTSGINSNLDRLAEEIIILLK